CHDHKIDPIAQKDYYSLLSFFHNINHYRNGGPTDERPLASEADSKRAYERRREELQTALTAFETDFRKLYEQIHGGRVEARDLSRLAHADGTKLLGAERYRHYAEQQRELQALLQRKAAGDMALCVTESGTQAPETFVLLRGNPHVKGDKVVPAFPLVLGGAKPVIPTPSPAAKTTGRRLVLA